MEGVLKSRVIGADIRIDVATGGLVVVCIREAKAVDQSTGRVLRSETAQSLKRIPAKVTEHTDIPRLADEITEKFAFVNPARRQELLECLNSLRLMAMGLQPDPRVVWKKPEATAAQAAAAAAAAAAGAARVDHLQEYVEMLYEEGERRIAGANKIKELAMASENLEVLAEDKLLLELLSRVLREEASKSIDLANAVLGVVMAFSSYSLFHESLFRHGFDSACLTAVETELKRRSVWVEEIGQMKRQHRASIGPPEAAPPASASTTAKDIGAEIKKFSRMKAKQDEVIALALHVLLNLCGDPSESPAISQKMIGRGLLALLVRCLECEGDYSLLIVVTFLKNLSIFHEVVVELEKTNVISRIAPLLSHASGQLKERTVRLLTNLSLNLGMQRQIVASDCIPRLVSLLLDTELQPLALKVLLPISAVPENRTAFIYSQTGSTSPPPPIGTILFKLMVKWPGDRVGDVVMRLATNLTQLEDLALQVVGGTDGVVVLLDRASRTLDPALFRVLRNVVAASRQCRKLFEEQVEQLVSIVTRAKSRELVADVMGILSTFTSSSIDWAGIASRHDLIEFLASTIGRSGVAGDAAADALGLEAVALLGAVVNDRKVAVMAAKEEIVLAITALLLKAKQKEVAAEGEMAATRLMYAAYKFLAFKDTRPHFLTQKYAAAVLEWYAARGKNLRKIVTVTLDIISECDPRLGDTIKTRKFELYNQSWLAAVKSGDSRVRYEAPQPGDEDDGDTDLPSPVALDGDLEPALTAAAAAAAAIAAAGDKRRGRTISPAPSPSISGKSSLSRTSSPSPMAQQSSSSGSPSPRKMSIGISHLSSSTPSSASATPKASPTLPRRKLSKPLPKQQPQEPDIEVHDL